MIDFLRDALDLLGLTPTHLVAAMLGLLVSWGSTQALKKMCGWSGRPVAALSFILGFGATITVIPGVGWLQFWLAVAVGLAAPIGYKALKLIGNKRGWAWVDALSGDA